MLVRATGLRGLHASSSQKLHTQRPSSAGNPDHGGTENVTYELTISHTVENQTRAHNGHAEENGSRLQPSHHRASELSGPDAEAERTVDRSL